MINLEIRSSKDKVSFSIDDCKYIHGSNIIKKQWVIRVLKKFFFNVNHSEYALEKNLDYDIYLNDKIINTRQWKLYEIHNKIDLSSEFKLSSKTVMHKYFESILMDIEYEEIITTINALLGDLCDYILEKIGEIDKNVEVAPKMPDFNAKLIVKLLEIGISIDDLEANYFDLDYSNSILVQIKMIKKISEINNIKNYIVIIDVPFVTKEVIEEIENHCIENLHFIVMTEQKIDVPICKVVNLGNKIIDFADELAIYEDICQEIDLHYEIEEVKGLIKDYLLKKDTDEVKKLTTVL
jgi:hypothetical protein